MSSPRFKTEKEAKGWLYEDAIAHAVAPFLGFLGEKEIGELRTYLEDAVACHPRLRTAAGRAAKSLVEAKPIDADRSLPQAAKKAKPPEEKKPLALPFEGAPAIAAAKFHKAALPIINALANRIAVRWNYEEEELVGVGWLTAVEIANDWDPNISLFETYLWRCVRSRMLNEVMKASNRNEKPFGACYADTLDDDKDRKEEPEQRFRRETEAFAAAWVAESLLGTNPEELNERRELLAVIHEAAEKLPEKHRELFAKIHFEGMTLDAARTELGLADSTARLMHREALGFLRESVEGKSNVRPLRPKGPSKKD